MEQDQKNTIDISIETCEDKIKHHQTESRKLYSTAIASLIFFIGAQFLVPLANSYDQGLISNYTETLKKISSDLDTSYKETSQLVYNFGRAVDSIENTFKTQLAPKKQSGVDSVLNFFISPKSLAKAEQNHLSTLTKDLNSAQEKISYSYIKLDSKSIYILYAVFVLIFGVLMSLYRFHLKEISKYEHFLFGFHRIRIAAKNSKTGFEDEVKSSLSRDAFTMESKSLFSKQKVDSPIPGHPTSDAASFIISKVLDEFELKLKPKEGKDK